MLEAFLKIGIMVYNVDTGIDIKGDNTMKRHKYGLLKFIRNYRFHSVFFKNLLLIIATLLLPFFCLLGVTYYSYNQIYESKVHAHTDEMRTMIYEDVDSLFSELQEKLYFLSLDDDVKLFCISGSSENQFYNYQEIYKLAEMCKLTSDVIDDVYIYASSSDVIFSAAGLTPFDNFEKTEVIDFWDSTGSKYQFDFVQEKTYSGQKKLINMYYSVKYGATLQGLFVLRIDMYDLQKRLDYGDDINITLLKNNVVIFDTNNEYLGEVVKDIELLVAHKDNSLVHKSTLAAYGLDLVIQIENAGLLESLMSVRYLFVGVVIVSLLLSVLFAFYISKKIYAPITYILKVLEERSEGEEKKILVNKNEIDQIVQGISKTVSQKENAEQELAMRIKLLRKAQAVALQAQINPHFVDNTLETIKWMIVKKLGRDNDISEMLTCFSKLIHTSLENSDTFVSLSDEIEYVRKYLYIQEKRFNDQFEVLWSIPKELENCKVIKLILQPIVENAINYGIKPFSEKGLIEIKAFTEANTLYVTVRNSGLGLPMSKVEAINKSVRGNDIKESDHIGLSNVNQRIVLAFGPEYGVNLSSSIVDGTIVTLSFPYDCD